MRRQMFPQLCLEQAVKTVFRPPLQQQQSLWRVVVDGFQTIDIIDSINEVALALWLGR